MEPSLYAGKKVQNHILKTFLTQVLGKSGPTGEDEVTPKIFVFYGDHGQGKTSMLDLCQECVSGIPQEKGKTAVSILLDLEAGRFLSGYVPKTPRMMLDDLYTVALTTNQKVADALEPYGHLNQKISDIELKKARLVKEEWPYEVFLSGLPGDSGEAFKSWLETNIEPADLQLAENPVEHLTATLAECLGKLSKKTPLLFCIDGFELAGSPEMELWLTQQLLPLLTKDKFCIAIMIATSRAANVRSIRNLVREELLCTVSLAELPLTGRDIASIAEQRGIQLDADGIDEIDIATAGVPLIVQVALDNIKMNVPLSSVLPLSAAIPSNAAVLLQEVVTGFIKSPVDETTKLRVFSLAMLSRYNEDILQELWGITSGEIEQAFTELAGVFSFMRGRHMHGGMRDKFRSLLIAEAARQGSPLSSFFANFTRISATYYADCYSRMSTDQPDAVKRFADRNFQASALGVLSSLMWSSQAEAMKLLPGYFTEAVHYNPDFAAILLGFADDFLPLLSPESRSIIDALQALLPKVAGIINSSVIQNSAIDEHALEFLARHQQEMTDTQRGLLERMQGILAAGSGNFVKAVEAFNRSEALFGPTASERALLFEDYLCAGFAFVKSGEHAKTIEALSKALSIKADNFHAWNELARAHQALGDHSAATEAYAQAVKIDDASLDSWIALGNEYALLGTHEKAVDAFTRVTQLKPDEPAAWLKLGTALEALARYPEALASLGKVVAMEPDNWEALYALGRTQAAQDMQQEAIASLKKVVELKPDYNDAWKTLGAELYSAGSFDEAAGSLEKAAAIDGNDFGLWNAIGKAWQRAGNYDNAGQACMRAVEINRSCIEAWITLGQCQTELSNFKEAYASFAKAAELNPDDHEIWVSVGNCLYAQGKFDEAIQAFVKATGLKPDAESIWHNIGLAYQIQKQFVEAVEAYQKEIAINPDVYESWYQMGRAYAELGQFTESADCFARAVELSPESHDAWYRKGISLARAGNNADAIPSFIKAAELYQGDSDIWYQLGLSYSANGNFTEAVESLSRAIEVEDNRPEVHYQLGLARESLGQYDDAIASFRKAVELAPEKAEAWLHTGLCLNLQHKFEEALPVLRKTFELSPDNTEVLLPTALAHHAIGQYADAVSLYQQVIRYYPDSEEGWLNLALALHAMNNYEDALSTYHAVIQKWPGKDQAWLNMGLIYHAIGDLQNARDSYREAARLNPQSADSWYQLGQVYYATGQYGDAIQAFRKVTVIDPEKYDAWNNLGNSYLIWNENTEAVAAYKKAIEIKPDDFPSWGYLSSVYYTMKQYDQAAEAASKAFELKQDEPWILSTLALSRLMMGDAASAATMAELLKSADTSGQEVAKTLGELQKLMALNPELSGADAVVEKLAG